MLRGSHDNWEKLVGAVLNREELRRIAYCESLSSSSSVDFSSRFSFNSLVSPASRISDKTLDTSPTSTDHGARPIKFKEVKKATKNFHDKMWLGQGAFGPVFKGWIDEHTLLASDSTNGSAVAVKKWINGSVQHQEYQKEISYLRHRRHPNVVKLIGYCSKGDDLILVYEFMPKGSLDNHLFRGGYEPLSWATRMKVAIGAARALSFLHNMATPVIHRGCQCRNILLDSEFNAKLSDFSLARYGATGRMTQVSTGILGSDVSIAAEYGKLTEKSDVYSFGNILLELLSGSPALGSPALVMIGSVEDNLEWVKRYVSDENNLWQFMDTRLDGQYPHEEAFAVAKLICLCLSKLPDKRPRMTEVVATLQQLKRG